MANNFDLQEQEQLEELKHFWKTWGNLITWVLIVVMGAFAAWNGWRLWQSRQAQQATALAEAVDIAVLAGDTARVQQAFADLKSGYGGTVQAAQAALLAAKALVDADKADDARAMLAWVADKGEDEGLRAIARLRLAGLLVEQKSYDEALAQVSAAMPAEFAALAADRKGDVLQLQDKKAQAIEEYRRAWDKLDERADYRRLVEAKLNALGAQVQTVAAAPSAGAAQ
ncbi:tetratricopeptide repeat protein [Melaminivora jejuensis]|uniref:tetratricopeptide repeat protein n=1 Tax=Melaminivora jejuensis TaxID=1267217 RepID=UPI001ADF8A8D|nr:tetratricopeptide repeat protein [Melaminivora jejuensis]UHJ63881.1 tetratricopeptide repeat protein [Melaminivora jejuensis]